MPEELPKGTHETVITDIAALEAKFDTLQADIAAIKAKTDNMPDNLVSVLQDIHAHVE